MFILLGRMEVLRTGPGMIFALVKFSCSKTHHKRYVYESMIMEKGGSPKWTNVFESEHEMIEVISRILAKQKWRNRLELTPNQIRLNGQYFFDLELTREEAESLGWKKG
jgi:hypothetical protein